MFLISVLMIYWLLSAIYGNHWIKLSFGGINTFYILMGIGIIYSIRSFVNNHFTIKIVKAKNSYGNWFYSAYIFISIYLICIVLSYSGFYQLFDTNVDFYSSYIIRQSYVLFAVPIFYMIVSLIINNKQKIFNFTENYYFVLLLWIIVALSKIFIAHDIRCYRSLVFFLATIIFINNPNKYISWTVLIVTATYFCDITYSGTSILAIIAGIAVLLFNGEIVELIKNNTAIKISSILTAIFVLVVLVYNGRIIVNDHNTIWRIQYWANEFRTLKKTYYIGVGFGSAYASNSIYTEINNPHVFQNPADEGMGIFVITQHNSLVNAFYRMGFFGGIVFILTLIINPIKWYMSSFKNSSIKKWLKCAFSNYVFNLCIILCNPGLESPPFMIGFLFTFAYFIALLLIDHYDYINKQCDI